VSTDPDYVTKLDANIVDGRDPTENSFASPYLQSYIDDQDSNEGTSPELYVQHFGSPISSKVPYQRHHFSKMDIGIPGFTSLSELLNPFSLTSDPFEFSASMHSPPQIDF